MSRTLELSEELVELVRKDPGHPNAGAFARAAAELAIAAEAGPPGDAPAEAVRASIDHMIEAMRAATGSPTSAASPEAVRPSESAPAAPAPTAEQLADQAIARSTVSALLEKAAHYEQLAELGEPVHSANAFGKSLTTEERESAKGKARVLRERAVQIIKDHQLDTSGRFLAPLGV